MDRRRIVVDFAIGIRRSLIRPQVRVRLVALACLVDVGTLSICNLGILRQRIVLLGLKDKTLATSRA